MQYYVGVTLNRAKPMTRQEYIDLRGWVIPVDENPNDAGFLVEKLGGSSNLEGFEGFVTWIPADEFNRSHMSSEGLDFGRAVSAIKAGYAIRRRGWNGKGMFVYYVPPGAYPARTGIAVEYYGDQPVPYNAYMAIKNVDDSVSTWVPSVNDVLSEDWEIFTPTKEQHHA